MALRKRGRARGRLSSKKYVVLALAVLFAALALFQDNRSLKVISSSFLSGNLDDVVAGVGSSVNCYNSTCNSSSSSNSNSISSNTGGSSRNGTSSSSVGSSNNNNTGGSSNRNNSGIIYSSNNNNIDGTNSGGIGSIGSIGVFLSGSNSSKDATTDFLLTDNNAKSTISAVGKNEYDDDGYFITEENNGDNKRYAVVQFLDTDSTYLLGTYSVNNQLKRFGMIPNPNATYQQHHNQHHNHHNKSVDHVIFVKSNFPKKLPKEYSALQLWLGSNNVRVINETVILHDLSPRVWAGTFNKLWAWSLYEEYDKVILLDQDILIRRNLWHWLEDESQYGTPCATQPVDEIEWNSGAMVLSPTKEMWERILDSLPYQDAYNITKYEDGKGRFRHYNDSLFTNNTDGDHRNTLVDTMNSAFHDQGFLTALFTQSDLPPSLRIKTMPKQSSPLSSRLDYPLYKNFYFPHRLYMLDTIHFTVHKPWRLEPTSSIIICYFFEEWKESLEGFFTGESGSYLAEARRINLKDKYLSHCPSTHNHTTWEGFFSQENYPSVYYEHTSAQTTGNYTNNSNHLNLPEKIIHENIHHRYYIDKNDGDSKGTTKKYALVQVVGSVHPNSIANIYSVKKQLNKLNMTDIHHVLILLPKVKQELPESTMGLLYRWVGADNVVTLPPPLMSPPKHNNTDIKILSNIDYFHHRASLSLVFNMTQYDKLIVIDGAEGCASPENCHRFLLRANLHHWFRELPTPCAVQPDHTPQWSFGVMLVKPDEDLWKRLWMTWTGDDIGGTNGGSGNIGSMTRVNERRGRRLSQSYYIDPWIEFFSSIHTPPRYRMKTLPLEYALPRSFVTKPKYSYFNLFRRYIYEIIVFNVPLHKEPPREAVHHTIVCDLLEEWMESLKGIEMESIDNALMDALRFMKSNFDSRC